jgi:hypothetical protein
MTAKIFDNEGNQVIYLYSGIMISDHHELNWHLLNTSGQKVIQGAYNLVYVAEVLNNYSKIIIVK